MWATDAPARLLLGTIVALSTLVAWAQSPTQEDLEQARRLRARPTDEDIARAARENRLPTPSEARQAPSQLHIDAVPMTPARSGNADLGKVAEGFSGAVSDAIAGSPLRHGPGLLVFVSLGLPRPTLERLVDQAARADATLVVRGLLDGSMLQTAQRMQSLIGERQIAFQIDPQLFDRFEVSVVPTFVVLNAVPRSRDERQPALKAAAYASVAGDVSVDYALRHIARHSAEVAASARSYLSKLERPR